MVTKLLHTVPTLVLVGLATPAAAQQPVAATPSDARLASTPPYGGADVSEALAEICTEADATGLIGMALQDGEVLAFGAAGVRSIETNEPVSPTDPFHLGSCGNEEDVLSWDTTIGEALPQLSKEFDPGYAKVRIEDLLRHRGGIAERERPDVMIAYSRFGSVEGNAIEKRRGAIKVALKLPPMTAPGAQHDYSNYGYMTAAAMMEQLTGRPWEELVVEKVLKPLKMESAGVGSPTGDHVPVGHTRGTEGWKALPPGPGGILHESMGPAGLLHSNMRDWARFVADHLAGERGEDGLVKAASYQRLHDLPYGGNYACGWGIAQRNFGWGEGTVLTHNGSDNSWYSIVFAMPEWDLVIVAAANCAAGKGERAVSQAQEHLLEVAGFGG